MAIVYEAQTPAFTKNWKLCITIGGSKMVHARGCEFTKDWDINGCTELVKLKPTKHKLCPKCSKLAIITLGANDYIENLQKYKRFLEDATYGALYSFYYENKAKTRFVGDKLYVQCNQDNWYIDFSLEPRLFHNNYNMKQRDSGENWTSLGYHEHDLKTGAINEALRKISDYRYKEASKAHEKKRNSKQRMTFSELDPEYWGFDA